MENCKNCTTPKFNESNEPVSRYVFEGVMARMERTSKRLWITIVVLISMLFACNAVWLWAWTSYDYSSEEYVYTQDGHGTNIIGNDNTVDNTDEGLFEDSTDGTETDNQEEKAS